MIFVGLTALMILLVPLKWKERTTVYCVIIAAALMLAAGFRNASVGTDTISYVNLFRSTQLVSLKSLLSLFRNWEPLYYCYQSIIAGLTDNYTLLLLPIAAFFCIVVVRIIYKYSTNPTVSFLMFLSMGYYFFSMAGLRQTIAMGFLLLCMDALLNKHYWRSILLLLVAGGYHITSLSFAVVYLLMLLPLNGWFLCVIAALTIAAFVFGQSLMPILLEKIWGDSRIYEAQYGGISTLLLLVIISLCLVTVYRTAFRKETFSKGHRQLPLSASEKADALFIKMVLTGIPLQMLAFYQANAFRVAMMFHIASILIVPNTIAQLANKRIAFVATIVVEVLLLIQFFAFTIHTAGILPYSFCWD